MSAETAAEPRVYSHFGWINAGVSSPRRFLLGRTLFDQESSCDVVLDRALEERAPEFDLGGYPLDDWKQPAAMLFAKGCEAQSLMLLGSFAAPLMRLWPWDAGRNAMISLHGGANSGRNTALIAAQSVWGAPDATRITRLSTVSFEALSNLPVTTEILAQRDPSIIAAGLGKFVTGPWATLLLSSSAVPINGIIDDPVPGIELRCAVPRALIRPKDADRI